MNKKIIVFSLVFLLLGTIIVSASIIKYEDIKRAIFKLYINNQEINSKYCLSETIYYDEILYYKMYGKFTPTQSITISNIPSKCYTSITVSTTTSTTKETTTTIKEVTTTTVDTGVGN